MQGQSSILESKTPPRGEIGKVIQLFALGSTSAPVEHAHLRGLPEPGERLRMVHRLPEIEALVLRLNSASQKAHESGGYDSGHASKLDGFDTAVQRVVPQSPRL